MLNLILTEILYKKRFCSDPGTDKRERTCMNDGRIYLHGWVEEIGVVKRKGTIKRQYMTAMGSMGMQKVAWNGKG